MGKLEKLVEAARPGAAAAVASAVDAAVAAAAAAASSAAAASAWRLLLEQSQQSFLQRATLAQHPEQEGHEHLEEHHGFEDRS